MAQNIYEPLKFTTQGINDLANRETLVVTDGKITVDTVAPKLAVSFLDNSFADLEGKGLKWSDGKKSKSLIFKKSKLWTDLSVNLAEDQDYQIDSVSVLTGTELGSTVTKSNLKQLGILRSLRVSGSAEIGDVIYVKSDENRLGINTDAPAGALGIRDNGIDLVIGSAKVGYAQIGTVTGNGLELVTDNTPRITIKNDGEINVGVEGGTSALFKINGTLVAGNIISNRTNPVVFKETDEDSIIGKGVVWSPKNGPNKQLIYKEGPGRLFSTESLELSTEKNLIIDGAIVLSKTSLGRSVTESSLNSVGLLRDLEVAGNATIGRGVRTSKLEIGNLSVLENSINVDNRLEVNRSETCELSIDSDIVLGNPGNNSRTVTVYGQLAVGIANPEPGIGLTVSGPISFQDRKFLTGIGKPGSGTYNKGDIVWNNDPKATDYVGWVCVTAGSPGAWLPFGLITDH